MHSRRFIFLLLLIFDLLYAQQIGLAHMVGHIGDHHHTHSSAASVGDKQAGHDAPESLSHACSTCAVLAGFDFPLSYSIPEWRSESEDGVLLASNDIDPPSLAKPFYFQSRAPPTLHI